jgi:hypothetical protein
LEGEATLERRPELLSRPIQNRRIAIRVERAELPPSDLRRAIENLAAPGTPEAGAPLPPRAEETAVVVRVVDAKGQPVAGERVRVRVYASPSSGGHAGDHSGDRPHGWLLEQMSPAFAPGGPRIGSLEPQWLGTTDAAGEVRLRYRAPELGGVETLFAELAHRPEIRAFIELRVGLLLVPLPPNPDYFLVGGTAAHPSEDGDAGTSHFVAPGVVPKIAAVAAEFRAATGYPLGVNDSSLPWGGVFDIGGGWERPHYNHRDGTDLDLGIFTYGPEERALTLAEIELLAAAIRRQGGRPGFEGDHIHASFGTIRYAEGPPRPRPAPVEEEMEPETLELLEELERLLGQPDAASPAGKKPPASAPAGMAVEGGTGGAKPAEPTPAAAPDKPAAAPPPTPAGKPEPPHGDATAPDVPKEPAGAAPAPPQADAPPSATKPPAAPGAPVADPAPAPTAAPEPEKPGKPAERNEEEL